MKHKCKKWLKSAAGKISIALLLISIAFLVLAFSSWGNFTERMANNINNVLFGIATNLLGIIVTVSFVQYFIDKQGEQIECDKEWEKILLYNRTLTILLERYELFHNNVVTTSEKFETSDKTLKHRLVLMIYVIYMNNVAILQKEYMNQQLLFSISQKNR